MDIHMNQRGAERKLADILKTNFYQITGHRNKIYVQDLLDTTILEDVEREQRTEEAPNHIMIMASEDYGLETNVLDDDLYPNRFSLIYEMTNKFGIYFDNIDANITNPGYVEKNKIPEELNVKSMSSQYQCFYSNRIKTQEELNKILFLKEFFGGIEIGFENTKLILVKTSIDLEEAFDDEKMKNVAYALLNNPDFETNEFYENYLLNKIGLDSTNKVKNYFISDEAREEMKGKYYHFE